MDASTTAKKRSYVDETLQLASRLESQAHNAEWENVEDLAARIRSRVLKISEQDRRATVDTVLQILARVQTLALVSRHDVSDKLAEIQRGRIAVQAYDHFGGQMAVSGLR